MIVEVKHNLFVSDIEGCKKGLNKSDAIIHACRFPCHQKLIGAVNNQHPNYLFYETEKDLYLNIIDPEEPLFFKETFNTALSFIERHIEKRKVIIHCNNGQSRSPTIAMLYMFGNLPYREAQDKFSEIYPYYDPGYGIDWYMKLNWNIFYGKRESERIK
jgi:hypothetical protein